MKEGVLFIVSLFFLLCPFVASDYIIEPTNVPRFFIGSILLLFYLIALKLSRKELLLPSSILPILLLLFYIISGLSVINSFNIADGVFESQKIFFGILLFIGFYDALQTENGERIILKLLFRLIIVVSVISLTTFFIDKPVGVEIFQPNLFGHKNLLSSFLFLSLPFVIHYANNHCGKAKYLPLLIILLILIGLFVLKTRSVFLALIISTAFFFVTKWSFRWKPRLRKLVFLTILSLGSILAVIVIKNSDRFDEAVGASKSTASFSERLVLWDKTVSLIKEYPLVGVGTGNWQYNYSQFSVNDIEKARFYNTFFKRPHNDFLWVLSENGIFGFIVLIGILGLVSWFAFRDIFEKNDTKRLIYLSALLGLLVISLFSFPKERMTHIFMTSAILAFSVSKVPFFSSNKFRIKGIWFYPIYGVLILNCIIGFYRMSGEYYTKKSVKCQQKLDGEGAIENSLKAVSLFYTCDPSCTPVITYAGWGYNQKTDLTKLIGANEAAYLLSPYDYKVLSNYAYALLRIGNLHGAKEILLEAYRINSNYESTLLNLSVIEFNLQNYSKSYEWLQRIENYMVKYPDNVRRIKERL